MEIELVQTIRDVGVDHLSVTSRAQLLGWVGDVRASIAASEVAGERMGATVSLRSADSATPYIFKFLRVMDGLAGLITPGGPGLETHEAVDTYVG